MPQGRPELHRKFKSDSNAWKFLEVRGFTEERFFIKNIGRELTQEESDAIEYLVTEWDWGWEGVGI